jgi:general secretion pathway protein A
MIQPNSDAIESRRDRPALASGTGRLLIQMTGTGNLKIALDKTVVTIGRLTDNDFCIRSRFISRLHARIFNTAAGAIIEDLKSCNGVTVNARRVSSHKLRSGDLIEIGQCQLRYIDLSDSFAGDGRA